MKHQGVSALQLVCGVPCLPSASLLTQLRHTAAVCPAVAASPNLSGVPSVQLTAQHSAAGREPLCRQAAGSPRADHAPPARAGRQARGRPGLRQERSRRLRSVCRGGSLDHDALPQGELPAGACLDGTLSPVARLSTSYAWWPDAAWCLRHTHGVVCRRTGGARAGPLACSISTPAWPPGTAAVLEVLQHAALKWLPTGCLVLVTKLAALTLVHTCDCAGGA